MNECILEKKGGEVVVGYKLFKVGSYWRWPYICDFISAVDAREAIEQTMKKHRVELGFVIDTIRVLGSDGRWNRVPAYEIFDFTRSVG